MKLLKFRTLKPEEIECRIEEVTATAVKLLIYKNARVDQTILDETEGVGPMNWQRIHPDNNSSVCTVLIYDSEKKDWIGKTDFSESSDSFKADASDSFKRACVNWGIGRELYSAPSIWTQNAVIKPDINRTGDFICESSFIVKEIEYFEGRISKLVIFNEKKNEVAFSWPVENNQEKVPQASSVAKPDATKNPSKKEDKSLKEATTKSQLHVSEQKQETQTSSKIVESESISTNNKTVNNNSSSTTLTLEKAKALPAEIGKAKDKGWTLGETAANNPVNFRWIYMQPGISEEQKQAIRLIALNDETIVNLFAECNIEL